MAEPNTGLRYVTSNSPELVVTADIAQIRGAVLNLVNNARDAMKDKEMPSIGDNEFSSKVYAEGRYAVVEIHNPQIIPIEVQKRMGTSLFTTKKTGTGLGLVATRRNIERNSGRLEFESTPEKGTCFRVYLPLTKS